MRFDDVLATVSAAVVGDVGFETFPVLDFLPFPVDYLPGVPGAFVVDYPAGDFGTLTGD